MDSLAEPKLKICLVSISLAKGGAERSTAILTKMLHDEGFDVHIVLLNDVIDYEFKGKLFNLGVDKTGSDTPWKRLRRTQKLRKYLIKENFDYIIDTRARRSVVIEWIYLNYVYLNLKFIYIVHSWKLENYLTKNNWMAKSMIKRSHKIIGVSKAISERINSEFKTQNALTIYNSVESFKKQQNGNEIQQPYILFLGRIDEKVKNLSLLIAAYNQSQLPNNGVRLYIVGDGDDKDLVQQKINSYKLQNQIKILPFTANIYFMLKDSLFLVLTSRYEGFPMVLIEALSVGTPVISVKCKSGPSEIVDHEKNGLLVENHNPKALAQAFDRFLLDTDIYNTCKSNSKQSVAHLNQKIIGEQWSNILKS